MKNLNSFWLLTILIPSLVYGDIYRLPDNSVDTYDEVFSINRNFERLDRGKLSVEDGMTPSSHIEFRGTAPTVSACGTSPSIVGNDQAGIITVGTSGGSVTGCTLTFTEPWTNTAICTGVTSSTGSFTAINSASASAVTFWFTNDLQSGRLYYRCTSYQ